MDEETPEAPWIDRYLIKGFVAFILVALVYFQMSETETL